MRECTYCKSPIVKTKSNPEQKCAYKLCDGFGFNRIDGDGVPYSLGTTNESLTKFTDMCTYIEELGNVIEAVNIVDGDKLLCIGTCYPCQLVLTLDEFLQAVLIQHLDLPKE